MIDRDEEQIRRDIVNRLRAMLDSEGMTPTELSRLLDRAHAGVGEWFRTNALPTTETLVRIAKLSRFRRYSVEYLLTGEGPRLRSTNISTEQAYQIGGLQALNQAAEEVENIRRAWVEQRAGKAKGATVDAADAADAIDAVESAHKASAPRRKRAKRSE